MPKRYKIFFLDRVSCYLNSLGDALSQEGHRIYYQPSWNWAEIEAGIAYYRPDLLITVGSDLPLRTSAISNLPLLCQKYKLFHIYWATEDGIHHDTWSRPYIERAKPDLVWTIHPDCVAKYHALGIPASYFNFALNPRLFPAKPEVPQEVYDLSFIGTTHLEKRTYRYESLQELVFPLIRSGRKVDIWGYNWRKQRPFIKQQFGINLPLQSLHGFRQYKETVSIYHQSKIMLGVQNARDQVTQRTFEIMGSGAFMLASYTEELERMFKDREEIVLSRGAQETLELADYYLRHPEKRYEIGRRARQRILQAETFTHRFAQVWPHLEVQLHKRYGMHYFS